MANSSSPCGSGVKLPYKNSLGLIFRRYSEAYIAQYVPSYGAIKLIRNIRKCRTPAMGSIILECKDCGEIKRIYKSCGDAKCPICQSIKRMQLQDKISQRMFKVPYVHTTFTLPHALNSLLRANPAQLYGLLFRSSWQTVKKLFLEEDNVGALPGMIAVLHTWGSDLKYHVHLHCLITFGGLDEAQEWQHPKRKDKWARFRQINRTFRDFYLAGIKSLQENGSLKEVPFLMETLDELSHKNWVVNNGQPQADTANIEEYLSRYILKIAVSNSRLDLDEVKEKVNLIYNDYRHQIDGKPAPKTLKVFDPLSFIHQFLQHLPPKYFHRLRYYGLHANATYKRLKDKIPDTLQRNGATVRTVLQIVRAMLGLSALECEHCKGTSFEKRTEAPDMTWLVLNIVGYTLNKAPPRYRLPSSHNVGMTI